MNTTTQLSTRQSPYFEHQSCNYIPILLESRDLINFLEGWECVQDPRQAEATEVSDSIYIYSGPKFHASARCRKAHCPVCGQLKMVKLKGSSGLSNMKEARHNLQEGLGSIFLFLCLGIRPEFPR